MKDPSVKPSISILDRSFRYVPSVATSVADTWRRFGWRPASRQGEAPANSHGMRDVARSGDATRAATSRPSQRDRSAVVPVAPLADGIA